MNTQTDLKDLALEAVLLYHSASPWDDNKQLQWQNLCVAILGPCKDVSFRGLPIGSHDATTRKLCDLIRKVRE